MTREERLQPIADLAKSREDRAAAALAQQRRLLEDQQQRLSELQQFQREYSERFQAISRDGIAVQRLNEYRRFEQKLREAILQQSRVVDDNRRRLEALGRRWSEASVHRRALDKTIDRFHGQTVQNAARKEQREIDDRAQRLGSLMEED